MSNETVSSLNHRGKYPARVDIDGINDKDGRVTYIGDATFSHGDGVYRCLARVDWSLCFLVEVKLTFGTEANK